jgi:hypothetical protein
MCLLTKQAISLLTKQAIYVLTKQTISVLTKQAISLLTKHTISLLTKHPEQPFLSTSLVPVGKAVHCSNGVGVMLTFRRLAMPKIILRGNVN